MKMKTQKNLQSLVLLKETEALEVVHLHITGKMASINTLGAVVITDGGVPRTFTGKAKEDLISGEFVFFSGATGVVGSDASSFASSDIEVALTTSPRKVNGLVIQGALAGDFTTFARRGEFLIRAAGAVTGGTPVGFVNATIPGVANIGSGADVLGRALTTAASGTDNYALISLNL